MLLRAARTSPESHITCTHLMSSEPVAKGLCRAPEWAQRQQHFLLLYQLPDLAAPCAPSPAVGQHCGWQGLSCQGCYSQWWAGYGCAQHYIIQNLVTSGLPAVHSDMQHVTFDCPTRRLVYLLIEEKLLDTQLGLGAVLPHRSSLFKSGSSTCGEANLSCTYDTHIGEVADANVDQSSQVKGQMSYAICQHAWICCSSLGVWLSGLPLTSLTTV